jgi:glutamate-ammonia-ligase adenylyltransferase
MPAPDAIFQHSPYLQHQLTRHPEWLAGCESSQPYATGALVQAVIAAIVSLSDYESVLRTVRLIRNREMLRIAYRDLQGLADVEETLQTTSDLADGLVAAAYQWCYAELCAKHGIPRSRSGESQQMVIIGMGKLGGQELNFSSDIDLIFAFPEAGATDGKRDLDNQTFFTRVGQRLIGVLGQTTAEGIAYRVDMRLRPFGEVGALALSFDAMEHYYETHGREWERYALIKARVIAGDQVNGTALLQRLRPFVYRRYLDYGAIEQLRDMKALINREAERRGKYLDVKLGTGGIREIEFTAQVFQLIRGGRIPELRGNALLPTLAALRAQQLLTEDEFEVLRSAYHFLRRTENRLQMWHDAQTHSLPTTPERQACLAQSMGFADWGRFEAELRRHQVAVSQIFQRVFALETQNSQPLPEHPAIQALLHSRLYNTLTDTGRSRLHRLLPALWDACHALADPEQALERCLQIVQKIAARSGYIAMLADHPNALAQFVRLVSDSLWITSQLTAHPILLDQLLDSRQLYAPLDRQQLGAALRLELERIDQGDIEQVMERLRQFKQAQVLRVAAADITGLLPLMQVSDQLTWIAEAVLEETQRHVWATLTAQTGVPCYQLAGVAHEAGFAIIAYGKLGGLELGYGSDLDIIFLHDSQGTAQQTNGKKTLENAVFYARFAQKIIHTLTTFTPAGRLYATDIRLRPSGASGLLVSSLTAFRIYQQDKAWVWEHQALLRARVITGSASLRAQFAQVRHDILCQPRDKAELRKQVIAMRQKMWESMGSKDAGVFNLKKDPGGVTDIEFIVQFLILAHAHTHPELVRWSDNIRQLAALQQVGILPAVTAAMLADVYRTLRDRIHALALQEQDAVVDAGQFAQERDAVRTAWVTLVERV